MCISLFGFRLHTCRHGNLIVATATRTLPVVSSIVVDSSGNKQHPLCDSRKRKSGGVSGEERDGQVMGTPLLPDHFHRNFRFTKSQTSTRKSWCSPSCCNGPLLPIPVWRIPVNISGEKTPVTLRCWGGGERRRAGFFYTSQKTLTVVKFPLYPQANIARGSFFAAYSNFMSVNMPKRMKSGFATKQNFDLKNSSSPSGNENMSQENVYCVGLLHVSITGICYFEFQMSSRNFVLCGLWRT